MCGLVTVFQTCALPFWFGRPPHGPGNRLLIRERVQSRNRRDRARRVDRRMTCAWGILLTDVRPTHPFMAAPARARQGQHSGRIAHPSGGTRLGGLARAGLEPEGPRPKRARPNRVATGWGPAQGLPRMAYEQGRPAKFKE